MSELWWASSSPLSDLTGPRLKLAGDATHCTGTGHHSLLGWWHNCQQHVLTLQYFNFNIFQPLASLGNQLKSVVCDWRIWKSRDSWLLLLPEPEWDTGHDTVVAILDPNLFWYICDCSFFVFNRVAIRYLWTAMGIFIETICMQANLENVRKWEYHDMKHTCMWKWGPFRWFSNSKV